MLTYPSDPRTTPLSPTNGVKPRPVHRITSFEAGSPIVPARSEIMKPTAGALNTAANAVIASAHSVPLSDLMVKAPKVPATGRPSLLAIWMQLLSPTPSTKVAQTMQTSLSVTPSRKQLMSVALVEMISVVNGCPDSRIVMVSKHSPLRALLVMSCGLPALNVLT